MPSDDSEQLRCTAQQAFRYFILFIKGLSCVVCVFLVITQIMIMHDATQNDQLELKDGTKTVTLSFQDKAFIVLSQTGQMCLTVAAFIVNIERPEKLIKFFYIFNFWPGRGFLMAYLGVVTLNQSQSMAVMFGGNKASVICGAVCGWILISVGVIFMGLGLMCLRNVSMSEKEREKQKQKKSANLEEPLVAEGKGAVKALEKELAAIKKEREAELVLMTNLAALSGFSLADARKKYSKGKVDIKAAMAPAMSAVVSTKPTPGDAGKQQLVADDDIDDDFGRKKNDEDDLEKAYYGRM
eukprot:PhM_4_TR2032/c0_g1_i1/m.39494